MVSRNSRIPSAHYGSCRGRRFYRVKSSTLFPPVDSRLIAYFVHEQADADIFRRGEPSRRTSVYAMFSFWAVLAQSSLSHSLRFML